MLCPQNLSVFGLAQKQLIKLGLPKNDSCSSKMLMLKMSEQDSFKQWFFQNNCMTWPKRATSRSGKVLVRLAALCATATISGHARQKHHDWHNYQVVLHYFLVDQSKKLTVKSQNVQQEFCYD